MILFRADMAQAILEGRKTVTRRRGARRWKVGSIHQVYTRPAFARPPGQPFASVRIVSVTREAQVGTMMPPGIRGDPTSQEAHREGFRSWREFEETYTAINGPGSIYEPCWRVEFALVKDEAQGAA